MSIRPDPSEHAPYYTKYIALVPGDDILATVDQQARQAVAFLKSIPEELGGHRYAPGKWTIKEAIGHIIDTERIMAYRALRIARNDKINLPSFEQDDYIPYSNSNARRLGDLIEEFACVRHSTLLLLKSFDQEAWGRRGRASDNEVTVRALAYIIVGHELHHRGILKEKYLA